MNITNELVNPGALQICKTLNEHGHQAFIVGGCVRDLLLNEIPKDWDITTDAKPEQVIAIFPKTYPTGIDHGTVTVSLGEGIENNFEVTTFRVEGEYKDGRRPEEVSFVTNVEDDLSRRDLTINAIAYEPSSGRLIDPFGGMADIEKGIIRAVGNANDRFKEDGLRIMRAARFAARFNYHIEINTFRAMKDNLLTLSLVSKERVRDELCKTLMTKSPVTGLLAMLNSRILMLVTPKLFMHCTKFSLLDQKRCLGNLETRLAFLYKNVGREEFHSEMKNLKFSVKEIKQSLFLHDLINRFNDYYYGLKLEYRQFMSIIKNSGDDWSETLTQFIIMVNAIEYDLNYFKVHESEIVFSRKEMNINGNELMKLGMKQGPEMKIVLDKCYAKIIENPEDNTLEILSKFALNQ